jgi:hypothetical protein
MASVAVKPSLDNESDTCVPRPSLPFFRFFFLFARKRLEDKEKDGRTRDENRIQRK